MDWTFFTQYLPESEQLIAVLLYGLAIILASAGFVGCILPYPGHPLVLAACVAAAFAEGTPYPAWWVWGVLVVLMIAGFFVDTLTSMIGTRKFGGSKAAMWGTIPGIIVGAFFPPVGLIVGPFISAFLCEMIFAKKDAKASSMSGLGATLGYLAGVVAKLIIAAFMVLFYLIF